MPTNWGNFPKVTHTKVIDLYWRDQVIPFETFQSPILTHGQGRSYGDSCLNANGILISTKHLNHFIHFDPDTGIVECEAGMTLADILAWSVPRGWFLPVLPGTKFVSVGGAIANDIHGKNHHSQGTFGNHVIEFELLRSDQTKVLCSSEMNTDLFQATIGGLGLTGLILRAKLQLKKLISPLLQTEYIKFNNLDQFFTLNQHAEKNFEYTVAWLDCANVGKNFGRGIFMRANHSEQILPFKKNKKSRLTVPFHFPASILNNHSIKAFNHVYFNAQAKKTGTHLIPYEPFFFPLDSIQHWNRIYGKKGFLQYQCVLPMEQAEKIQTLLKNIVDAGQGSFLSVLKTFGDITSKGLLSFPMKGVTLALDIPFRGEKTLQLLTKLDEIVMQHGGRVYPAKDARMSATAFKTYFPQWETFSHFIDPQFSSSFWRRVINHET